MLLRERFDALSLKPLYNYVQTPHKTALLSSQLSLTSRVDVLFHERFDAPSVNHYTPTTLLC